MFEFLHIHQPSFYIHNIPVYVDSEASNHFNIAYKVVFKHEGTYSNDKHDPGGPTNYGISLRFLKDSDIDINDDGKINIDDVLKINQDLSEEIIFYEFWAPNHLSEIHSQQLVTKILDLGVNMGMKQAVKLLQMALNRTHIANLKVDGKMGPATIKAANYADINSLMEDYRFQAKHFYINLVAKNPELMDFLKGWERRAAW